MNDYDFSSGNPTVCPGDNEVRQFFKVCIADRNIEIECKYRRGFIGCKSYLAEFDKPDFIVSATNEEIEDEFRRLIGPGYDERDDWDKTEKGDLEQAVIHRKIADNMLRCDTLLIHGAAVSADNRCYIFTAPSGTGKTTHILHWLDTVPGAFVVNGDKPLVNVKKKLVYGTPWCGKENMNTNTSVPLAGLIQLERGEENILRPLTFRQMLPVLLQQSYIPAAAEEALLVCNLIGQLRDVPCYHLSCTPDEEAAVIAYRGLTGRNPET